MSVTNYEIDFEAVAKSQSSNPDGSTQFITSVGAVTDGTSGTLMINTSDAALDAFFPIGGTSTASVSPS